MTQESIVRRGEEIASTSSSQETSRCEEICLMAIKNGWNQLVGKGQSIVGPPLFVSNVYAYWKTRLRLFIQGTDYEA